MGEGSLGAADNTFKNVAANMVSLNAVTLSFVGGNFLVFPITIRQRLP